MISDKTRKTLWARSGNRCAICRIELVAERDAYDRNLNIGEECHIISSKGKGPRHLDTYEKDFDDYENLILLCRNHHKTIDEQIETYPVVLLHDIKADHEQWVNETINSAITTIYDTPISEITEKKLTFAERVSSQYEKMQGKQKRNQILNSAEGLKLAFDELKILLSELKAHVEEIKKTTPDWHIHIRPNKQNGSDVLSYGYYLTVQFYQQYSNSPEGAYLFIALIKGIFNTNGEADPFTKNELIILTRVQFDINEIEEYGWSMVETKENFKSSVELIEIWFDKFITLSMEEMERRTKL
jgi:hypothetical protein